MRPPRRRCLPSRRAVYVPGGSELVQLAGERQPILDQEDEAGSSGGQEVRAEPEAQPCRADRVLGEIHHERGLAPVGAQPAPTGLLLLDRVEYVGEGLRAYYLDASIGDDKRIERGLNAYMVGPALDPSRSSGQVGVCQDGEGDESWDDGQWAERRVQDRDARHEPP